MKSLFAMALGAMVISTAPAMATPISEGVWKLENNTYHGLGSAGFYRFNGESYDLYDFETNGADVRLTYDAEAGTIDVSGQAYDSIDDRLVDIDLGYTGVSVNDDRVATSFMGTVGTFDGVEVMAKSSKGQSLFLFDEANTGHGWIGTSAGHFGDFHFEGTRVADLTSTGTGSGNGNGQGGGSVPAPGGIGFMLLGAIALLRLKKQKA